MSGTSNEYENPGGNLPDRGDADGAPPASVAAESRRDDTPSPAAAEPSHEAVGLGVVDSSEGTDHHGQDEGRDTLSVGEAQRLPGGLGTEQEQRLPGMAQNDASAIDKVAGIVAQTRADVGTESLDRIADVLRQRLTQSGIDLPDADVEELARQVSTGDARSPEES
ncbi:hypothetical protein [Microbacterium deminutum]|uniref:Uncharacterized protein n=1 Tax=Microbacterium deminutum TaxID=344164 RepID=A0ABN2R0C3_9MICO